jgi:hypothetical protein
MATGSDSLDISRSRGLPRRGHPLRVRPRAAPGSSCGECQILDQVGRFDPLASNTEGKMRNARRLRGVIVTRSRIIAAALVFVVTLAVGALYWRSGSQQKPGAHSPSAVPLAPPTQSDVGKKIDVSGMTQAGFHTPTGNIACVMSAGSGVRCDIRVKDWTLPRPPDCDYDWGNSLTLGSQATAGCVSDAIDYESLVGKPGAAWFESSRDATVDRPGIGKVAALRYAFTMVAGNFSCAVSEAGVRCSNTRSKASFFMSRSNFEINSETTATKRAELDIADAGEFYVAGAWSGYFFTSPSGRFQCGIRAGYYGTGDYWAGCHGDTSPIPKRPQRCPEAIGWGHGMEVAEPGAISPRARYLCASEVIYAPANGSANVLEYGRAFSVEGFTCSSLASGITCKHTSTGHGFTIASKTNSLF